MLKKTTLIIISLFIPSLYLYAMPNPASVYCVESAGGELTTKKEENKIDTLCRLPNGEEIEEWELYYKDHNIK